MQQQQIHEDGQNPVDCKNHPAARAAPAARFITSIDGSGNPNSTPITP
jgi:hypothetical protein